MNKEKTLTIFSDYDDLFGICNVFARSHEVLNTCTFYLADGSLTPYFEGDGQMKIEPGI